MPPQHRLRPAAAQGYSSAGRDKPVATDFHFVDVINAAMCPSRMVHGGVYPRWSKNPPSCALPSGEHTSAMLKLAQDLQYRPAWGDHFLPGRGMIQVVPRHCLYSAGLKSSDKGGERTSSVLTSYRNRSSDAERVARRAVASSYLSPRCLTRHIFSDINPHSPAPTVAAARQAFARARAWRRVKGADRNCEFITRFVLSNSFTAAFLCYGDVSAFQ